MKKSRLQPGKPLVRRTQMPRGTTPLKRTELKRSSGIRSRGSVGDASPDGPTPRPNGPVKQRKPTRPGKAAAEKHGRDLVYPRSGGVKYEAKWVNLIPQVRAAMRATGKPYVIENVPEARPELIDPVLLCGHMFGLRVYRHRLFESNVELVAPPEPKPFHPFLCTRNGYLPTPERPFMSIHGGAHSWAWQRKAAEVMGAPWIGRNVDRKTAIASICEAIPPAYTEYIGRQLVEHLNTASRSAA